MSQSSPSKQFASSQSASLTSSSSSEQKSLYSMSKILSSETKSFSQTSASEQSNGSAQFRTASSPYVAYPRDSESNGTTYKSITNLGQGATYNSTSTIGQGARVSHTESPRSPRTPLHGHHDSSRSSHSRTHVSTYSGSSSSGGTVVGGGGRVLKMVTEMGSTAIAASLSEKAAKSFLEATDKEKKDLQGLNDRLGNYIGRVKRLEEQNKRLVDELDELRGKWGKDTSAIKIKYADSLSVARKDIDNAVRHKTEIDVKVARLRDDLADYRARYDDLRDRQENEKGKYQQWTHAIADAQNELEMLRARYKQLNDDEKRLNNDNARLWDEVQKARADLDEETIGRVGFQDQVQTLLEELEFLRRVHEQEVKELQAMLSQAPVETREYFKNELALAIRDIKDEYENIATQGKKDMESWYKLKVSEVQTSASQTISEGSYQREEVSRMRHSMADLRGKLGDLEEKNALLEKEAHNLNTQLTDDQRLYEDALNYRERELRRLREESNRSVIELQELLATKQILDAEIAIYRKMLEGEESRVGLLGEKVVAKVEDEHMSYSSNEISTTTRFHRSAHGNVTFGDCDWKNGTFISLENTHGTKDENLSEYKVQRKLDNGQEISYTFPANTVLKAGKKLKIYARDQGPHSPPNSLVNAADYSWGIGANVVTQLMSKEGEERATLTQKTAQTQSPL